MAASKVTHNSQRLARFDVVGELSTTIPGLIRHVGLFSGESCDVAIGQDIDVVHMKPPFRMNDQMAPAVYGKVPLTTDEARTIDVWLCKVNDELSGVVAREQYVIDPPITEIRDGNTRARRYNKYSCVGFILDAHHQVDIELLDLCRITLPEIESSTIHTVYGNTHRLRSRFPQFGLHGDGPWRIVMAGYVIHALNRPTHEIRLNPYRPKKGDECFP